jgi:hypothetical protein
VDGRGWPAPEDPRGGGTWYSAEVSTVAPTTYGTHRFTELHDTDPPLPVLWARDRIRHFEEGGEGTPHRGSQQAGRKRGRTEGRIIDLSTRYGVLSRLTSFVAVEQRADEDKTEERAEIRKIPVLVTQGWHGRGSVFGGRPPTADTVMRPRRELAPSFPMLICESRRLPRPTPARCHDIEPPRPASAQDARTRMPPPEQVDDLLMDVLSLQRPEGDSCWTRGQSMGSACLSKS